MAGATWQRTLRPLGVLQCPWPLAAVFGLQQRGLLQLEVEVHFREAPFHSARLDGSGPRVSPRPGAFTTGVTIIKACAQDGISI